MNERQLELIEVVNQSPEPDYFISGDAQRLQLLSIDLRHQTPLSHDELEQCLTLLRSERYTPDQLQLIESAAAKGTLAMLIGGVDALTERAHQERLTLTKAELIECFLYFSGLMLNAALNTQDECEILEEELFFLQDD